jgi:hypothetical protein
MSWCGVPLDITRRPSLLSAPVVLCMTAALAIIAAHAYRISWPL